ncbi:MAG: BolA family protein [Janthinobacterium lividum]
MNDAMSGHENVSGNDQESAVSMPLRSERMRACITTRFAPQSIEVVDESALHAGHAGVRESGATGETHYAMMVVSEDFRGTNRVQRSRMVHDALEPEFRRGLHALSLSLRTPEEHARLKKDI